MKKCSRCQASNEDSSPACWQCGSHQLINSGNPEDNKLFTARTTTIIKILFVLLVLIALGFAVLPYIMWTLAGPMSSLG
jgi:uncharacterized membrane protein YvbJ